MRLASTIVSWLGALITTIWGFVNASRGFTVPDIQTSMYDGRLQSITITFGIQKVSEGFYAFLIVMIIVRLGILIWRSISLSNGEKVKCGVCTLLFVSVIGGILTLCIPEDDLW